MICQDMRENLLNMRQVHQGGRPHLSPEKVFPTMRVVVYNMLTKFNKYEGGPLGRWHKAIIGEQYRLHEALGYSTTKFRGGESTRSIGNCINHISSLRISARGPTSLDSKGCIRNISASRHQQILARLGSISSVSRCEGSTSTIQGSSLVYISSRAHLLYKMVFDLQRCLYKRDHFQASFTVPIFQ